MKDEDGEFPGNAGGGLVVSKGFSSGKASRLERLVVWKRFVFREGVVVWEKPDVQEGFAVRGRGVVQEGFAVRRRGIVQNVTRPASNRRCCATWLRVVP